MFRRHEICYRSIISVKQEFEAADLGVHTKHRPLAHILSWLRLVNLTTTMLLPLPSTMLFPWDDANEKDTCLPNLPNMNSDPFDLNYYAKLLHLFNFSSTDTNLNSVESKWTSAG